MSYLDARLLAVDALVMSHDDIRSIRARALHERRLELAGLCAEALGMPRGTGAAPSARDIATATDAVLAASLYLGWAVASKT